MGREERCAKGENELGIRNAELGIKRFYHSATLRSRMTRQSPPFVILEGVKRPIGSQNKNGPISRVVFVQSSYANLEIFSFFIFVYVLLLAI